MAEEKILKKRPVSSIEFAGQKYTRTKYEDYKDKITFEPLDENGHILKDVDIKLIEITYNRGKLAREEYDPADEAAKILARKKNKSLHGEVKSEAAQ